MFTDKYNLLSLLLLLSLLFKKTAIIIQKGLWHSAGARVL